MVSGEQIGRSDPQGLGQGVDVVEADVAFTALHAAHVGAVQSSVLGEGLLAQTGSRAQLANPIAEGAAVPADVPSRSLPHPTETVAAVMTMGLQTMSGNSKERGVAKEQVQVGDKVEVRGIPFKGAVGTVFEIKRKLWTKSYGIDLGDAHTATGASRIYTSGVRKL